MKNKTLLIVLAIIVVGIIIALVAKGGKGPEVNPEASRQAQCLQNCEKVHQDCVNSCSSSGEEQGLCLQKCENSAKECREKCSLGGRICSCKPGYYDSKEQLKCPLDAKNEKECESVPGCKWVCRDEEFVPGIPGVPVEQVRETPDMEPSQKSGETTVPLQ